MDQDPGPVAGSLAPSTLDPQYARPFGSESWARGWLPLGPQCARSLTPGSPGWPDTLFPQSEHIIAGPVDPGPISNLYKPLLGSTLRCHYRGLEYPGFAEQGSSIQQVFSRIKVWLKPDGGYTRPTSAARAGGLCLGLEPGVRSSGRGVRRPTSPAIAGGLHLGQEPGSNRSGSRRSGSRATATGRCNIDTDSIGLAQGLRKGKEGPRHNCLGV